MEDQGYAPAQSNLGVIYATGNGAPKNLVRAHFWFSIASAKGRTDAKRNLAIIEEDMTPDQKDKATKLARATQDKHVK